jgi:AraC-like DNA-binding protein
METPRHTIAMQQVLNTLLGAQRLGLDITGPLQRAGIPQALLAAPQARVAPAQYALLLRQLRRLTGDELWGLGQQRVPAGSFAQCCRLVVHCSTLGEALRAGFRFFHGQPGDFTARLTLQQGLAVVRLHPRSARPGEPLAAAALDYAERSFLFLGYGLACWLVARNLPLKALHYRCAMAEPGSETRRIFRTQVHYGAAHSGLAFDEHWLTLPVVQNPQSLREFLRHAPDALLLRYRDQASLSERIRRLLRAHLREDDMPSLEQVGRTLAMTPQTLRRRLREEGHNFQSLKDDLRRDAAIEYLARPELTLVEIASQLGFSEASTFHRAFKKWTGVAPGEYRQQRQAAAAPQP